MKLSVGFNLSVIDPNVAHMGVKWYKAVFANGCLEFVSYIMIRDSIEKESCNTEHIGPVLPYKVKTQYVYL